MQNRITYNYSRIKRRINFDDGITFGFVVFDDTNKIIYHYEDIKLWNRINKFTSNKIPHLKLDLLNVTVDQYNKHIIYNNGYLEYTELKIIQLQENTDIVNTLKYILIDKYYNNEK